MNHEIHLVEEQQRRLAQLYVAGSIPADVLDSESERLNHQRMRLESERQELESQEQSVINLDLDHLAAMLPEATTRLRQWVLETRDHDLELILDALDLQIRASREEVQIEGTVPVMVAEEQDNLVTIERTSA